MKPNEEKPPVIRHKRFAQLNKYHARMRRQAKASELQPKPRAAESA